MALTEDENGRIRKTDYVAMESTDTIQFFMELLVWNERMKSRLKTPATNKKDGKKGTHN